ncbi:helix-turn-helix transcriptional regulator [Salisediminibacterium halotolerans]|uniref:Predicted transcriptional regulator, ArsR family n=1 Tax=Salisediminibacterium halotolerans TaxID=517425 RepID=A0A1H9SB45_9BACI|nr:helix-turn-helix domain-containing protein [Salisediminibacterium haloalkalitolerans]SER82240.1 Predicted transcriptional regulator, ArsR family [Salisediminibacterium haloalkalitolerans]
MEQHTLKITGVLSDPTRYSIYQYIGKQKRDVTVQEIADTFKIHANVARLHLSKLEEVNMLVSDTKKTGKGGRPSRFYRLSDEVISIQFPFRDYQRLAEIAIDSLASLGYEGIEALRKTGLKFGYEAAHEFVSSFNQNPEAMAPAEKTKFIEQIAINQGLNPELHYDEQKEEITFRIYNCTFKEVAKDNRGVCAMHHSLMNGIFQYFFPDVELKEEANMMKQNELACTYTTAIVSS